MRHYLISFALLGAFAVACGSSSDEDTGEDYDRGTAVNPDDLGASGGEGGSGGEPSAGDPDLSFQVDYPEGPYGSAEGSVIRNHTLLGWRNPRESLKEFGTVVGAPSEETLEGAIGKMEPISMADFYDPAGEETELLFFSFTAVWCYYCREEYKAIRNGDLAEEYAGRKVKFIGALIEDNDGYAATYGDVFGWANSYEVSFPFMLDPSGKMGEFFVLDSFPSNMIVDATTMKVVRHMPGGDIDGHLSALDTELEKRGL